MRATLAGARAKRHTHEKKNAQPRSTRRRFPSFCACVRSWPRGARAAGAKNEKTRKGRQQPTKQSGASSRRENQKKGEIEKGQSGKWPLFFATFVLHLPGQTAVALAATSQQKERKPLGLSLRWPPHFLFFCKKKRNRQMTRQTRRMPDNRIGSNRPVARQIAKPEPGSMRT
nr:hypothetical protein [Pandoravirus massiliensis]